MREENKKWHTMTLQAYDASMFETLIYPYNIITESVKSYTFENEEGESTKPYKGFFAMKDIDGKNIKYFIEEDDINKMPIRIDGIDEVYYKDSVRCRSVIHRIAGITPFKITPEQCWTDNHAFIDEIASFSHTNPDAWTLNKMIAIMGYVGKTFCGVCSEPEFGKSSVYLIMNALTHKCPVFQPRSVAGVLRQITGEGNIIFDDIHSVPSEVNKLMENFSFHTASNAPIYINGALKSKDTKLKYDIAQQSLTYLFNLYKNYSNPNHFWNYLWKGREAMESRFLLLKFEGVLTEKFDKDFDIPKCAEDNKMYYIKVAKHLMYLKQLKIKNQYELRYNHSLVSITLKGRHKIIYDEILWIIDLYSNTQDEFNKFVVLLNKSIRDYANQFNPEPYTDDKPVFEEYVQTDEEKILDFIKDKKKYAIEDIIKGTAVKDIDDVIERMKQAGDLFEPKAGFVEVL